MAIPKNRSQAVAQVDFPLPKGFGDNTGGDALKLYPYDHYDRNRRYWDFMSLSYKAGSEYKDGIDSEGALIFQAHRKEADEGSNERKARSSVPSYARFFVQRFDGYVANSQVGGRSWDNPDWQEWSVNVTGSSREKNWVSFVRQHQHSALKSSPAWARLDTPAFDGSAVVTEADRKAQGIQVIASIVDPRNVVDYEIENEELTRLVVRKWIRVKGGATKQESLEAQFTEWTSGFIATYRQIESVDSQGRSTQGPWKVMLIRAVENTLGFIPYVPLHFFEPEEENPMFSPSMIHDVCAWMRDIFRVGSLLDEEIFNRTFTTQVITGARGADIALQAGSMMLVIENDKAKVDSIGSDTKQTEALLDVLQYKMRQLFRAAQFESSGDTKESRTAESGVKKSRDLEGLYTVIRGFVERCETAENQLREMWARMMSASQPPKITYAREFDFRTPEEDTHALQEMILAELPPTFLRMYRERIMKKAFPVMDPEDEKEIENELDAVEGHDVKKAIEAASPSGVNSNGTSQSGGASASRASAPASASS